MSVKVTEGESMNFYFNFSRIIRGSPTDVVIIIQEN